jgi:hypothetical protein
MPKPVGIMTMRDVRGVGLNPKHRHLMTDQLRRLFSNDLLDGLNDDQLYDLFEQYIDLPGLTHIGYKKPPKPTPNSNVIPFPPEAITDWWKPRPGDPNYEEEEI